MDLIAAADLYNIRLVEEELGAQFLADYLRSDEISISHTQAHLLHNELDLLLTFH